MERIKIFGKELIEGVIMGISSAFIIFMFFLMIESSSKQLELFLVPLVILFVAVYFAIILRDILRDLKKPRRSFFY